MRHGHKCEAPLCYVIQSKLSYGIFQQSQIALQIIKLRTSHLSATLKVHPAATYSVIQMVLCTSFAIAINFYLDGIFFTAQRHVVKSDIRDVFKNCRNFFLGRFQIALTLCQLNFQLLALINQFLIWSTALHLR